MSKVVLRISFALGGAYFALGGILFLHGMRDSVAKGSKFQPTGLLNLALPFCIKSG
jgi:hypothetical protein